MKEAFAVLEEITGVRGPRFQVPYGVAWTAAVVDEFKSKFTGLPPRAPLGRRLLRMALHPGCFLIRRRRFGVWVCRRRRRSRRSRRCFMEWFRAKMGM